MLRPLFIILTTIIASTLGVLGATTAPASAKDANCTDFSSQAAAQSYFISRGGPYSDPDGLDSDGDGIACESRPCPCSTSTTPITTTPVTPPVTTPVTPPVAPPPATTSPRTETKLKVNPKRARAGQMVRFKITRLYDPGTGELEPTTGKVSLEQKLRGRWRTIKGSRHMALNGYLTLRYRAPGAVIKVRAKSSGPTSYSEIVMVR